VFGNALDSLLGKDKKKQQQNPAAPIQAAYQKPAQPINTGLPRRNPFADIASIPSRVSEFAVNKIAAPAGRAVQIGSQAIADIPTRITEALDPNDAESRGDALLNQTASKFGFTPQFKQQLYKANPQVINQKIESKAIDDTAQAAAYQQDNKLHRIVLDGTDNSSSMPTYLLHEGLHDVYSSLKPETISNFNQLVNRAYNDSPRIDKRNDPRATGVVYRESLKDYLNGKLSSYKDNIGIDDVSRAPASIQNEIHSYIPDYYGQSNEGMPSYLRDYYANYYNTGGKAAPIQRKSNIERLLGRIFR
jgi:hypothetical protein